MVEKMNLKNPKSIFIILNFALLILYFNYSVLNKEKLLASGELIKLELAPVDPRSLIQGDYMELRYAITDSVETLTIPKRGYIVVTLDEKSVAKRKRIQEDINPRESGEYLIRYNTGAGRRSLNIGAESYFFQEGQASKFEKAKYGGLIVDRVGNSLLDGMYDEFGNKL